jgi:hypothetical protein
MAKRKLNAIVISECLFEVMLDEFVMVIGRTKMAYNGTAIEGVCVTWRNPPVDCPDSGAGKSPGGPPGMVQYLPSRCARALSRSRYKEMVYR